jgi:hypothetical protein
MLTRRIALATLAAVGTIVLASSTIAGTELRNANRLTLNTPVRLPGVMLLPGSYSFQSGPVGTHHDIVRVTSANNKKLHYVGFTRRVARPANIDANTVLTFEEAPVGAPKPIGIWFPLGSKVGHEFIYR